MVGRDLRADMRITHPLISRAHLLLRFDQGRWLAIDNGSLNGTFVNGRRVPVVDIHDGQSINIGNPDGPRLTFEVGRHQGMAGRPPETESMGIPVAAHAVWNGVVGLAGIRSPGSLRRRSARPSAWPTGRTPLGVAAGDRIPRTRAAARTARATACMPSVAGARLRIRPAQRATAAQFPAPPADVECGSPVPRPRHRRPRCRPAPPSHQRWRTWRRRCSTRCCHLAPGRCRSRPARSRSAGPPTTTSSSRMFWRHAITRF